MDGPIDDSLASQEAYLDKNFKHFTPAQRAIVLKAWFIVHHAARSDCNPPPDHGQTHDEKDHHNPPSEDRREPDEQAEPPFTKLMIRDGQLFALYPGRSNASQADLIAEVRKARTEGFGEWWQLDDNLEDLILPHLLEDAKQTLTQSKVWVLPKGSRRPSSISRSSPSPPTSHGHISCSWEGSRGFRELVGGCLPPFVIPISLRQATDKTFCLVVAALSCLHLDPRLGRNVGTLSELLAAFHLLDPAFKTHTDEQADRFLDKHFARFERLTSKTHSSIKTPNRDLIEYFETEAKDGIYMAGGGQHWFFIHVQSGQATIGDGLACYSLTKENLSFKGWILERAVRLFPRSKRTRGRR